MGPATLTIEVLTNIFATYGVPEEVVSDNGKQFTSEEFQRFLKMTNAKTVLSSPYHPSANGEAEIFARTFKRTVKASKDKQRLKNHKTAGFLLCYWATPHSTTHKTS